MTLCVFLVLTVCAQAATLSFSSDALTVTVGDTVSVDLIVSGLETEDLKVFDIDVAYSDTLLCVAGYTLYDGLGDIESGDAEDFYDEAYQAAGIVNLCEMTWLEDDALSFQADSFVLATLSFTAIDSGTCAFSVDFADLTTVSSVPVPSAFTLLGLGLCFLAGIARKKAGVK